MQRSKRSIEDYALYLIIGSIYAFAVNISVLETTALYASNGMLFLISLGFIVLFGLIFLNRISILISVGVLAIVSVVIYFRREEMEEYWYFINEVTLLVRGYLTFRPEFNLPLIIAICLLVGLFVSICMFVDFQFYFLAAFGSAIFIVCWIMEYPQSRLGFVLFLFCFCVLLIRKLQGRDNDGLRATLVVAPLCAILVGLVSLVPIPENRLDGNALERLINEPLEVVGEFFFLTFNPKYFSFQTTGFGGHGGRLGGPVAINNRPVMAVDAPRRVYLSGASHNVYTGYGWTSIDRDFVPTTGRFHPSYIEFLETSNALFRNTSHLEIFITYDSYDMQLTSYMPMGQVDIFIGGNRTGSLFRPMRERGILFENPELHNIMLTNPAGDRRLETLLPRNTMYRYHFLDLDYRDEHIQEILRASRPGIYSDRLDGADPLIVPFSSNNMPDGWIAIERYYQDIYYISLWQGAIISAMTGDYNVLPMELFRERVYRDDFTLRLRDLVGFDRLLSQFQTASGGEVLMTDLGYFPINELIYLKTGIGQDTIFAEYADFVRENYLDLPNTLPDRVRQLAFDITYEYETDYEKIRALQEFLIQFPYTLVPTPVPAYRDFVDYFLFDGQEGYCVYYASAMVVMSRAIGIPARYVEGFLLPAIRDPYTNFFTVTNRDAHAWAEIYFEGFGWLIVETTAPYVFAMYERPFFVTPGTVEGWGFGMEYEEYLRAMGLWYMMYGMDGPGGDWELDFERLQAMVPVAAPADEDLSFIEILAIVIISIVAALLLYFIIQEILRFMRKRRLMSMSPNDRAIYYYREILKITDYWRYPVKDEETLYEYGQRIRYRFTFARESMYIRDLNDLYYKARYRAEPLSEDDADLMKACYYELVDYVRVVRSRRKFFYIRYIKRVIAL